MEQFLQVGVFANTHGLRGEIKVYPTTDDVRRFDMLIGKTVYLDAKKGRLPAEVSSVRYFKNMVILKFKGMDNINDVEPHKGCPILVDRENAVPLEEDEYFVADLIGLSVVTDEGRLLGTLKDVLQTGANDVYVVKGETKEYLLPVIRQCVLDINLDEGRVLVHMMDGLEEL